MLATANGAEVANGNLYVHALGWNWTRSPFDLTIVARVEAPAAFVAAGMPLTFTLVDSDGAEIELPPIRFRMAESPVSASEPPPGVEVPVWLIFDFWQLDISPGRYSFRVEIDQESEAYPFTVEPSLSVDTL